MNFLQLALAGQCFIGSTAAAGVTIPIYNATAAHTAVLFNPASSGVNVALNKVLLGQADATTPAISGLAISYLLNAQGPATGAAVVSFTDALALNSKFGGPAPKARFGAASLSATALLLSMGLSQDSATPAAGLFATSFVADGSIILPPASLIAITGAPIAPGQDFVASVMWAEIPIA